LLHGFGLDDTGWIVYKAVLAGPAIGIDGLSARTGLLQDQVRTALEALADLHLVRASSRTPMRWEPVNPQLELAVIVQRQEADLARRQQEIAAAFAAAAGAYGAAFPAPSKLERLEGLKSVQAQAENLTRSTLIELRITITAPQVPSGWQVSSVLDASRVTTGVNLRVLYHDSASDDPATVAEASRLTRMGAQTRMTSDLPPLLMISDHEAALIPLQAARPGEGAVCVREPVIVATLTVMFEDAWNRATALGHHRPLEGRSLTAGERTLLRLLADGLTDEAAARRLGISVRTVRRQMSILMDKLGASSRFQAGHKAAQQGWLLHSLPQGAHTNAEIARDPHYPPQSAVG